MPYYAEELRDVLKIIEITTLYIQAIETLKCDMTYEPAMKALEKFIEDTAKLMIQFFKEMNACEEMLLFEKLLEGSDD